VQAPTVVTLLDCIEWTVKKIEVNKITNDRLEGVIRSVIKDFEKRKDKVSGAEGSLQVGTLVRFKSLTCPLLFVSLFATFNLAFTNSNAQSGSFLVSVAGTASGSIPHHIDLKVTQLPGGQLSQVTGFVVGPEDVVQVKQGENLIVNTSANLKTRRFPWS
jgi:hypothetical protein